MAVVGDKAVDILDKKDSTNKMKNPGEIGASTFIVLLLIVGILILMVSAAFQRLQPLSEDMSNKVGVRGEIALTRPLAVKETGGIVEKLNMLIAQDRLNELAMILNDRAQPFLYDVCAAIANQLGQVLVAADNIPGRDCGALILELFTNPATQLRALSLVASSTLTTVGDKYTVVILAIPEGQSSVGDNPGNLVIASEETTTDGQPMDEPVGVY